MNFFKEMVDSIEKRCIEVLLVDTENITYLYTNVWQLFNKLTCVCVCVCVFGFNAAVFAADQFHIVFTHR